MLVAKPFRSQCLWVILTGFFVLSALSPMLAVAGVISLQQGTATFSQPDKFCCGGGSFSPNEAIDGNFGDGNGWAIFPNVAVSQAAVWETATDVNASLLEFSLAFNHFNPGHLLGSFRMSVTGDDRDIFADGLESGGDVTANWIVLTDGAFVSPAGLNLTEQLDGTILASGITPPIGEYTLTFAAPISNITGFRLEAIPQPSLPSGGSGLFSNGNFVLTEIGLEATASAVPEPSSVAIMGLGLIAMAGYCWRRGRKVA